MELLVVFWCLLLLVVLILPALTHQHHYTPALRCLNNLKQDALAFRTFALDHGDHYPMELSLTNGGTLEFVGQNMPWRHFSVMSNELSTPKVLVCPEDADRIPATTFTNSVLPPGIPFTNNANLSYFVAADASEQFPSRYLTGDHNIRLEAAQLNAGLHFILSNSPISWDPRAHESYNGNVAFADGSARQINSTDLRKALAKTGLATNRLEIP